MDDGERLANQLLQNKLKLSGVVVSAIDTELAAYEGTLISTTARADACNQHYESHYIVHRNRRT